MRPKKVTCLFRRGVSDAVGTWVESRPVWILRAEKHTPSLPKNSFTFQKKPTGIRKIVDRLEKDNDIECGRGEGKEESIQAKQGNSSTIGFPGHLDQVHRSIAGDKSARAARQHAQPLARAAGEFEHHLPLHMRSGEAIPSLHHGEGFGGEENSGHFGDLRIVGHAKGVLTETVRTAARTMSLARG